MNSSFTRMEEQTKKKLYLIKVPSCASVSEGIRSELFSVDVGLGTVGHWQGFFVPMRLLQTLIHASWAVFLVPSMCKGWKSSRWVLTEGHFEKGLNDAVMDKWAIGSIRAGERVEHLATSTLSIGDDNTEGGR